MDWEKVKKVALLCTIGAFFVGIAGVLVALVWFGYTVFFQPTIPASGQPLPIRWEFPSMKAWLPALIIGIGLVLAAIFNVFAAFMSRRNLKKQLSAANQTIAQLQNGNKSEIQTMPRVSELERLLSNLQEKYDDLENSTKWLRDIADDQAKRIQECVSLDGWIDNSHRLVGDDLYIRFRFQINSRCVYGLSLLNSLNGRIYFGQHLMATIPELGATDEAEDIKLNGRPGYFDITQPLAPREAAQLLNEYGSFGLHELQAKLAAYPDAGSIKLDFTYCSIAMNKEFIDNNYPKLNISVVPLEIRTYFGRRESESASAGFPLDHLGTVLSLHVCFKNPRPLKVRQFTLVTSGPEVAAEKGKIGDRAHRDAKGQLVPNGNELSPNLANLNIDIGRDNITEGWLQFIVRDIRPQKMLNPSEFVVRLHVVDESGEEHRQDVTGLKYKS